MGCQYRCTWTWLLDSKTNNSFLGHSSTPLSTPCPLLARASFRVCNLSSCTASQAQWDSTLGFMFCCCHLEIMNTSWTRNPAFSFCTGPWKLCSQPWPGFMDPDPEEDMLGRTTSAETPPGFCFWQEAVGFPVLGLARFSQLHNDSFLYCQEPLPIFLKHCRN